MKLLFKNADIYTPDGVIKDGFLAVEGDTIAYVGAVRPEGVFDVEKDMSHRLLLPGLVNTHTHAAMTLLRGVGTDLPLHRWLTEAVFPLEGKMTAEDIRAGSALALLEMLGCGTTSFSDMYFHPDTMAELVASCGMKANLNYPVQSFNPAETYEQNESARKLESFHKAYHGAADGRIRVDGCLHAEYTCNPHVAAGTAAWCKSVGGRMHIHLSETKHEHEGCLERYGMTPAEWMNRAGVFDVPCQAAHCVWVSESDRRLMKEKGVAVVHNPSSNMKLGSGFAPIPQMLDEGILVSLGTDGAASNNTLNMVKELHLASIIHNGYHGDAALMTAKEIITMATRSGALAQGREDTGELTVGKKADIIAVALDRPHLTPHIDTEGLVAYSMQGSDVVLTMVDGRILYENGEYLTLDKEKIIYEANAAAARLMA